MKNKLKSVRRGSKTAAALQPKTPQSRAIVRPESNPPCIALFPQGDTNLSEKVIDLSKAEYAELKRAAAGPGILMFMANAALEKIETLKRAQVWDHFDICDQWELLADKALAVIQDLQDAYWSAIDKKDALETSIADGRIGLALDVMHQIQEHKELAGAEHKAELVAFQLSEQRRAA